MNVKARTLISALALVSGCVKSETSLHALTAAQAKTDKPIVAQCIGANDPLTTAVMAEGTIQVYAGDILLDMDGERRMTGRNSKCRIASDREMEEVCVVGSKTLVSLDATKQFTISAGGWPVTFVDEMPLPDKKDGKKKEAKVTLGTPPESTYCLFRVKAPEKANPALEAAKAKLEAAKQKAKSVKLK